MSTLAISSWPIQNYRRPGSTAYILLWCSQNIIASDGITEVLGGAPRTGFSFKRVDCDVNQSTHIATPESFSLITTNDSSVRNARVSAALYDVSGAFVQWLFSGWIIPEQLVPSCTFGELTAYNAATSNPPAPTFPTTDQVEVLINARVPAPLASDVAIGISELTKAPVDPLIPIAVGNNDPRVIDISSYATFAAMIAAVGSTPTTFNITSSISIPSNTTVPSTLTLRFLQGGSVSVTTGATLIIRGAVIADPVKIFYNAVSGQGTISFSGNRVIKDFSPEWWGAVADGSTENRTFIHAMFTAIKTAGGGRWLLPANTNYLYSPSGTYGNSLDCFSQEASNIVIEGSGWSSVITTGGSFGARFGIPYQQQNYIAGTASGQPWTLPSFARFNDATVGGSSVTLTTPSQHSLFAVGNIVFLESGDAAPLTGHSPYSFEFNEISAINTGTGEITLRYGLRDSYDSVDASYEPRIVRLNTAPNDITLRNLKITRAAASVATLLDFSNCRNVHVENCYIRGLEYTTYSDGVWFEGNLMEVNDLAFVSVFDSGDAAQNQFVRNNTIRYAGAYGIIFGGSFKDITIEGNHISGYSRDSAAGRGITLGGALRTRLARGIKILNNTVILDTATSTGIVVSNADNPIIKGNTVRGNLTAVGAAGILLSETVTGWRLTDNEVEITGSNAAALLLSASDVADVITKGAAVNNTLHAPAIGINLSNGSLGNILKNRFAGNDVTGSTVRYRANTFTDNTIDGIDTADMRGTFTISDANTTSAVSFAVAWDDAAYRLTITPTTATGGPAAGSNVFTVAKTSSGFTVTIATAPGGGKSQAFDWKVER